VHQFQGEYMDGDLGLYWLRARWMNPQTGEFMTMDGYEGDQADPTSLHKYAFTYWDGGVNKSDPTGHDDAEGNLDGGNGVSQYLLGVMRSIALINELKNKVVASEQAKIDTYVHSEPKHYRCVIWDGLEFYVPANLSFRAVYTDGANHPNADANAIWDYVGHYGKWDIQRNLGKGILPKNTFYDYYQAVSNFNVGIFMEAAGYTVFQTTLLGDAVLGINAVKGVRHLKNPVDTFEKGSDEDIPYWKAGWDYADANY
jgi:RHS repeat-associated protein